MNSLQERELAPELGQHAQFFINHHHLHVAVAVVEPTHGHVQCRARVRVIDVICSVAANCATWFNVGTTQYAAEQRRLGTMTAAVASYHWQWLT